MPVPVGVYNLNVTYEGISTDVTVNASALGVTYVPAYDLTVVLAEYTEPGTFTFTKPSDLLSNTVYITACGGGAGGSFGSGANGSSGGGAGNSINKKEYSLSDIEALTITVGAGGLGGYYHSSSTYAAKAGNATIVGGLVTLAGGNVGGGFAGGKGDLGTSGNQSTVKAGENGGGTNGGKGGATGTGSTGYWYSGGGGGGQGADCLEPGGRGGNGAKGGSYSADTYGGAGTKGSGGGGSGGGSVLAGNGMRMRGGDGYVKIEMILSVK